MKHERTALRSQRKAGPPIVLKLGGELLEQPERIQAVGSAIAGLRANAPVVVVHGGGKDIDAALARVGIAKKQVDGLRITDAATLDIVVAVLAGLVNTRLVAAVTSAGVDGVGLTGADAAIGLAGKAAPHVRSDGTEVDLGRVGIPRTARAPRLMSELCSRGYIPIVASIGMSRSGELYNVNADTFAAHLAAALGAERLVIAGSTDGVLDARGQTIPALDFAGIDGLVRVGTVTAGMIAKLTACRDALSRGVREVLIANGHDLTGLAELVRRGTRAEVAGCTEIRQSLSAQRVQSSRGSAPRSQSGSNNVAGLKTCPGGSFDSTFGVFCR